MHALDKKYIAGTKSFRERHIGQVGIALLHEYALASLLDSAGFDRRDEIENANQRKRIKLTKSMIFIGSEMYCGATDDPKSNIMRI